VELGKPHVRFEIFMVVKMSMLLFWVVMPCGLIDRYQHLEKHTVSSIFRAEKQYVTFTAARTTNLTHSLHLQILKHWCLPMSPHGITTLYENTFSTDVKGNRLKLPLFFLIMEKTGFT
jgi:hypothetical protein